MQMYIFFELFFHADFKFFRQGMIGPMVPRVDSFENHVIFEVFSCVGPSRCIRGPPNEHTQHISSPFELWVSMDVCGVHEKWVKPPSVDSNVVNNE